MIPAAHQKVKAQAGRALGWPKGLRAKDSPGKVRKEMSNGVGIWQTPKLTVTIVEERSALPHPAGKKVAELETHKGEPVPRPPSQLCRQKVNDKEELSQSDSGGDSANLHGIRRSKCLGDTYIVINLPSNSSVPNSVVIPSNSALDSSDKYCEQQPQIAWDVSAQGGPQRVDPDRHKFPNFTNKFGSRVGHAAVHHSGRVTQDASHVGHAEGVRSGEATPDANHVGRGGFGEGVHSGQRTQDASHLGLGEGVHSGQRTQDTSNVAWTVSNSVSNSVASNSESGGKDSLSNSAKYLTSSVSDVVSSEHQAARQTDHCVQRAEPILESYETGCKGFNGGQQHQIIANLVGSSPAQVWHVGTKRGMAELSLAGSVSVLSKIWPQCPGRQVELGHKLLTLNEQSGHSNVLFVRGSKLDKTKGNKGVLRSLVSDWLRNQAPVVAYVKGRRGIMHDNARQICESVGGLGGCFPVCSCLVTPGVHSKGLILTNIPGLKKEFTECATQDSIGRTGSDRRWHCWIFQSIIKRLPRVLTSIRLTKEERQHHH